MWSFQELQAWLRSGQDCTCHRPSLCVVVACAWATRDDAVTFIGMMSSRKSRHDSCATVVAMSL